MASQRLPRSLRIMARVSQMTSPVAVEVIRSHTLVGLPWKDPVQIPKKAKKAGLVEGVVGIGYGGPYKTSKKAT